MERSRTIFLDIASATHNVIARANEYANRKNLYRVQSSHFQLEDEMKRVSVACGGIAGILGKLTLPDSAAFDVRLRDWLGTDEPQRCLDTLLRMDKLLQKDTPSWLAWIFRGGQSTESKEDKIEEAVEHFRLHKAYFHFLLSTDILNNEKDPKKGPERVCRQKTHTLDSGSYITLIRKEIDPTISDSAIHQSGHSDHVVQESSNALDQSLLTPVQAALNTTMDDAVRHGENTVEELEQVMVLGEQEEQEECNAVDASLAKKVAELLQWLDGMNCAEKQDDTLSLRQPDTCKWLFDTRQYKKWRDDENSFLWLRGKPGAGKSVLASAVIHSIETSPRKEEILIFFYCDFRIERTTSSVEVLRSILSQLLRELRASTINPGGLLDDLIKAKERGGSTRNSAKELAEFASRAAALWKQKPLIIVDALDECKDVEALLQSLMTIRAHVRLFVTSRPLHVIMGNFSGLPFISMNDMKQKLSSDIWLHVIRQLDTRHRLRDLDNKFKDEIRSVLCKKAGGMFRWVQCSIDTLDRCVTRKEIRGALNSLPEGLDETYERILLAIDMKRREGQLARRALTWLVAALRPLRLRELVEGISVNVQTHTLDLDFGPMHKGVLLDACGSLVTYSDRTDLVMLSHFSVKEYLTGEPIRMKLPQYHINWEHAHLQIARSCICYLSAYLSSGNSSNVFAAGMPNASSRPKGRPQNMSHWQPLRNYVTEHAIDHFQYLGSQFESILYDIEVLANRIRQHPSTWSNLCRSARRIAGPTAPSWPPSKHDLILYILIAYAPNSLLRTFLRRTPLGSKSGTNPLIYAAYFNKGEHARTMLSWSVRLNRRGWDIAGFFQVLPIEVALQTRHFDLVALFVAEGSTIPSHIFTNTIFQPCDHFMPHSIVRMLLQTDTFPEIASNEVALRSMDIFRYLPMENEDTYGNDIITIHRRISQALCDDFMHDWMMLRFAIEQGYICVARYLLFHGVSLPSNLFHQLDYSGRWLSSPMLRLLAENGANIRAYTAAGDTVLLTALRSSIGESTAMEVVKLLILHGCNPLEASSSGKTPLYVALKRGFAVVAQYFLSFSDSPLSSDLLRVALSLPDEQQRVSMVICLLDNGTNVPERTVAGDPVLHIALRSFRDEDNALRIIKLLISHGCNPLEASSSGKTLLFATVKLGFVSIAQYLLTLGALLPSDLSITSLCRGQGITTSMLRFLVENRGNEIAAGISLLYAILQSCEDEVHILEAVKVLVYSLRANTSKKKALRIAVKRGFVSVTRYLFSLGVSHDAEFPNLLRIASRLQSRKKVPMITCLVENGSDVHVRTAVGDSVLHATLRSSWEKDEGLDTVKALINHGCNPLELDSTGKTPLRIAVEQGHVSVAQYLLSLDIYPSPDLLFVALSSQNDSEHQKALMLTCLIKNGANVHVRNTAGDPVLSVALRSFLEEEYALEAIKILVAYGCNPLEAYSSGDIPLRIAVEHGLVSVARYLLSLGISPSPDMLHIALHLQNSCQMLLMIICLAENRATIHAKSAAWGLLLPAALRLSFAEAHILEVVKVLVNHGCNPLEADTSGKAPLCIAVERGLVSIARYLISLGISPSPNLLYAALHLQTEHQMVSMSICLVENGANVHAIWAATGLEPLLPAVLQLCCREEYAAEIVRALVKNGCCPFEAGSTPLRIAVKRGFVSVVRYLLSTGIHPSPDLLHVASSLRDERQKALMIFYLVRNGVDVHVRNTAGDPILPCALRFSWDGSHALEIVKVLVSHGCDPLEADSSGKTPLRIAVEHGLVSVARYLLSHGLYPSADMLHIALSLWNDYQKASMIVCLVENGANVHVRNARGDPILSTALRLAGGESHALEIVKVLVSHGCDPREADSSWRTPLRIAVDLGFVSVAHFILSLGPSPSPDLLHIALNLQNMRQMTLMTICLVKNGADVRVRNTAGDPVLHAALRLSLDETHALEIVKVIIRHGCDPLETDSSGNTSLRIAIERSFVSVARYLLSLDISQSTNLLLNALQLRSDNKSPLVEGGANVRARTEARPSIVLHNVLLMSQDEDHALKVTKLLLDYGYNPFEAVSSGRTPLHVAIERGFVSVARYLLSFGISPSPDLLLVALLQRNEQQQSQILRWLEEGTNVHNYSATEDYIYNHVVREEISTLKAVKFLVSRGCNPSELDSHSASPLRVAVEQGHATIARILLTCVPSNSPCDVLWIVLTSKRFRPKSQTINLLIDQGAKVLAKTKGGDSMLHVAISSIDDSDEVFEIVGLLLIRGCDPTVPNDNGVTPLHLAVERGHIFVVMLLLRLNVPIPVDILFTAIESNLPPSSPDLRWEIVNLLVMSGCDTQTRDAVGRTPLEAANREGHLDVVNYLYSITAMDSTS